MDMQADARKHLGGLKAKKYFERRRSAFSSGRRTIYGVGNSNCRWSLEMIWM